MSNKLQIHGGRVYWDLSHVATIVESNYSVSMVEFLERLNTLNNLESIEEAYDRGVRDAQSGGYGCD